MKGGNALGRPDRIAKAVGFCEVYTRGKQLTTVKTSRIYHYALASSLATNPLNIHCVDCLLCIMNTKLSKNKLPRKEAQTTISDSR